MQSFSAISWIKDSNVVLILKCEICRGTFVIWRLTLSRVSSCSSPLCLVQTPTFWEYPGSLHPDRACARFLHPPLPLQRSERKLGVPGTNRSSGFKWEFPKIRGTFLGVPTIRIIVYWGSILGSPYFGKLPNIWTSCAGAVFT